MSSIHQPGFLSENSSLPTLHSSGEGSSPYNTLCNVRYNWFNKARRIQATNSLHFQKERAAGGLADFQPLLSVDGEGQNQLQGVIIDGRPYAILILCKNNV